MFLTSSRSSLSIFEKILSLPQFPWILRGFWGRMGKSEVVWTKRLIFGVRICTHNHVPTAFAKPILIFFTSKNFFEVFRRYKNMWGCRLGPDMNIKNHSGDSFRIMFQILAHFYDFGSIYGGRRKILVVSVCIILFEK